MLSNAVDFAMKNHQQECRR